MHKYSGTHFLSKNKDFNNGNSLRITEKEDIASCYFTIEETKFFFVTPHYIYRTSMFSFGGCFQEPLPILRYVLDKCLNA